MIFSKPEKNWQMLEVRKAQDFSSIKVPGKVKSNQFAIISPRRTGIIQDLLVDIGDDVYKGQTIGSMLPEGVEGQGSAAISTAAAQLAKARAELNQARGVAIGGVSVASQQWRESHLQLQTKSALEENRVRQLAEKKSEAFIIATQTWENVKLVLFGPQGIESNRGVIGNFNSSLVENKVKNMAYEIYAMESSDTWATDERIVEHLSHLESFLSFAEKLYKKGIPTVSNPIQQIASNQKLIQSSQLQVSRIKQQILALEEKGNQSSSLEAEKGVAVDKSREILDLVQSQQNLSITKAEQNVDVAYANYNAALVKAGHQSLTSPYGGTITARMVEVGQAVTPNTALFYLEGAETARSQESLSEIHFGLPSSWKDKASVGDLVTIRTMDGTSIEGSIFRLSKQISLRTHSIMGTAIAFETRYESIDADDNSDGKKVLGLLEKGDNTVSVNLTHGQDVFLSISDSESDIFTVPSLALKKRSSTYYLWKMEGGTPRQLQVEILAEDGEFSQVFSRILKEGDLIIGNPSVSLFKSHK